MILCLLTVILHIEPISNAIKSAVISLFYVYVTVILHIIKCY